MNGNSKRQVKHWASPDGCYEVRILQTCYGWDTKLALNCLIIYMKQMI